MPNLGDYLGHLMIEITNARVQADLESVRLAEMYASHPLLKHMPVPHFRLPTVNLDVPVIIEEMEKTSKRWPPSGRVVLPYIRKSFDRLLPIHLKNIGIELSDEQMTNLRRSLDNTVNSLRPPPKVPLSVTAIASELVATTIDALRETKDKEEFIEPERLKILADNLKTATHVDFSKFLHAPSRINVLVTTAELKEAGQKDFLANIHLSITEEAVEWSVIESEGKSQERLIPE